MEERMFEAIVLMWIHFVSDWMLQPRAVAKRKTVSVKWMGMHVGIIYVCFAIYALIMGIAWWIPVLNAVLHAVIDKVVWKGFELHRGPFNVAYREKNAYAEDWWFYTYIGADQILHTTLLFVLFL
jgi:hypothetical protein